MKNTINREGLKHLIDVASGRVPADLVIRNSRIVDVFSGSIRRGDIAICDGVIAGVGSYRGRDVVDAGGRYAAPGFIDSHIHIESSYVSPEEIGRLLVPHGTTTIIADPHEIVNVCGLRGFDYMMNAASGTALDIKYMLPSCVPATPFEHSGARVDAADMEEPISRDGVLGLGEFMDFMGVIHALPGALDKVLVAKRRGKRIDGHAPGVSGRALDAYAACGIIADHECSTVDDMNARVSRGMYVMLREGSACHNLRTLASGVTRENSRRCLLCSDDRTPETIFRLGHIDSHLRMCVSEGIDAVSAIRMATLNASECFGLYDRGAIAPGRRADIVLLNDMRDFRAECVFIRGVLAARGGKYLLPVTKYDISSVKGSVKIGDFSSRKLKMHLKKGLVNVIEIMPGGVVTKKSTARVALDSDGEFVRDEASDIVKVAVVERHGKTGGVACAFLKGYGIKRGAVALSIAHDSHNIIAAGVSDDEIASAVTALAAQEGGIVLVRGGRVIESMPLPIAGLMSDKSGEWVASRLKSIHEAAWGELGINRDVEPVMTLCFMSLAVIPEVKLTDMGLFDVNKFCFIPVEAQEPQM